MDMFPNSQSQLINIIGKFLEWMKSVPNDGLIQVRSLGHQRTVLLATTPEVVKQILNENAYDYAKNEVTRSFLRRFLGDGLIVVEGNQHKLQRKAVAPAFSGKHIKDLVPLMWTKSKEFVNVVAQKTQLPEHDGVIEVSSVASHVTLDIIGVACLGRDFKTLYNDDDELARTYETILNPENRQIQIFFFCNIILGARITNLLPWKMVQIAADCEKTLRRICRQLLAEGKASISKDSKDVDILSVMLRSSVELSEDELVAQLLTFLAAGHETTSAALTWNCYLLAKHPDIQQQLRQEIAANVPDNESVTADTFTDMSLLDDVCNEGFRLYPTVPQTGESKVIFPKHLTPPPHKFSPRSCSTRIDQTHRSESTQHRTRPYPQGYRNNPPILGFRPLTLVMGRRCRRVQTLTLVGWHSQYRSV